MTETARPDDDWGGDRAARWLRQSAGLERQLAPVSDLLFETAALQAGERVLDVGCGTGPTTHEAALAVGGSGAVTGLDLAPELLEAAAGIPAADGAAPITWLAQDVVTWQPPEGAYDVVLSRFGVMFFSDPARAFANLATATRDGGRLVIAVWSQRDASPMFEVPLTAVLDVRRRHGLADPDDLPRDGGPFSLGDVDATRALVESAGWKHFEARVHDVDLTMGGGLDPVSAAATSTDFGPTRVALGGLDPAIHDEALAAVAEAYAEHLDGDGHVVLAGRVITISARR